MHTCNFSNLRGGVNWRGVHWGESAEGGVLNKQSNYFTSRPVREISQTVFPASGSRQKDASCILGKWFFSRHNFLEHRWTSIAVITKFNRAFLIEDFLLFFRLPQVNYEGYFKSCRGFCNFTNGSLINHTRLWTASLLKHFILMAILTRLGQIIAKLCRNIFVSK